MGRVWRQTQEDNLVLNTKLNCLSSNIRIIAIEDENSIFPLFDISSIGIKVFFKLCNTKLVVCPAIWGNTDVVATPRLPNSLYCVVPLIKVLDPFEDHLRR